MDLMDPDEWDEDTATMAEAMGFASFGGQAHGSKRRKYNARADEAFVAGGDESTLPIHDAGSGPNNTPLGERRRRPTKKQKTKANADEIDLDDDDDDGDDDDDQNKAAEAATEVNTADTNDAQDPAPQYIDTSLPPIWPNQNSTPWGGMHSQMGAGNRRSGRDRASGQPWWEGYYDPAFNTNPWEKIEKARGMQPRGTWLSYDESKATWASIKDQSTSSAAATEATIAQAA
ncbi:hypothetical protein PG993_007763 [Apiospora rasikravindrae]|uniref:Uncharacterized protein n=1 Tax=Apiospora rasikravindrae TaxID=990691 RepID=A0ABR1SYS9_9PEZI